MSAAHCYVKMPPLPSYASDLKRAASTSGPSLASRKKPRVADVDDPDEPRHALNAVGGTRRPRHSHVVRPSTMDILLTPSDPPLQSSGAAIVREDSPMEDESNTVAMNLVRALSLANNEVPIYTNRPGQGRKRIIESDSEEMPDSPPHMNDSRHPPEEARTSARPAPAVASATTSLRSAPSDTYSGATPPLPRTSTLKRPRAEEALDTHERRAQPRHTVDMSGLAKDSVPAASDRPPKKRKGPPGLSQEEVVRRTSAQQQQQMREEQTAHRGPEPRKKSYSKSTHSVVKRPSTRAVEPPERRISRTDPPSFSSAENSFARPPASMEAQRFDEQDADMITFGSTNDDVAGTSSTAPTAVTVPLLSATEGSGTSQAVVAISGASDSTHVPASVSIRASVSASAGTPAPLFKQPPPALSMRTISARETDHPQPSRSVPLLAMLNSHNQADVTFGTLFESIRHLAAAGLATEQQGQRFEAALQSLQSEVRTLVQGKRNVEEELGSMKEQLRTLSGKLHADREERARQATVIRDLQQKCDRLEAGFSDRVREIVVPMITAHLQQMQYAPSAPPAPGPAAVGMPGPSHEYQHSGYDQGVGLPSGGVDVRPQSWDNNMGSRYGGPPSGFNAPPQDPYVAPPGQYNGRGQDGHFRGRGYGSGQGRHQSNGFPPRGPANGGGDGWNPRHRNDQGSQGGMGPRPNNHAPAQPWQGRGYRDERAYNQRRGSDDARGRPYDDRRRPRSVSRGGNDRRRMSRCPSTFGTSRVMS
ncbi:hypothetical protein PYCCODRAFT_483938 [Trametes coccinea BRFM310]|uniref:Uncharacterized protein n=1 Tax=Trametes coccinea (strain BRFM310) TaxID=1353009 RepID=A0A1Y2IK84_TRAC3|nr:hypothetical protein PYCCODRAFT_483938 [Trametes coccinea BRFM310]